MGISSYSPVALAEMIAGDFYLDGLAWIGNEMVPIRYPVQNGTSPQSGKSINNSLRISEVRNAWVWLASIFLDLWQIDRRCQYSV